MRRMLDQEREVRAAPAHRLEQRSSRAKPTCGGQPGTRSRAATASSRGRARRSAGATARELRDSGALRVAQHRGERVRSS
jgi:hypothetical protein